jgi:hypothetical protein
MAVFMAFRDTKLQASILDGTAALIINGQVQVRTHTERQLILGSLSSSLFFSSFRTAWFAAAKWASSSLSRV